MAGVTPREILHVRLINTSVSLRCWFEGANDKERGIDVRGRVQEARMTLFVYVESLLLAPDMPHSLYQHSNIGICHKILNSRPGN